MGDLCGFVSRERLLPCIVLGVYRTAKGQEVVRGQKHSKVHKNKSYHSYRD